MNGNVLFEIQGLKKNFGEVEVLKGIDQKIEKGEVVVVIGPSGSGKSTFIRCLNLLEMPTDGKILFEGTDICGKETQANLHREKVGMVFQQFNLFNNLSVLENITVSLKKVKKMPEEQAKEKALKLLDRVGLTDKADTYPSQLSGGQKQRIAIARALINNPRVLLLDEPLGALDLKLRKQMQIELKRLQKKLGITFVYVTHDQEEAMTMSDRIAVMRDGVILQMGAPMEIYERPATRFVADFIGESNVLEGRVTGVKEGVLSVETPAGGVRCWGQGFGVGDALCVAIRPEYLRISREPVDGFSLPATVKDFIYMGALIKTSLDLKNGQEVKLSRLEADSSLREGDAVHLWWEAEKAVAIHDDSRQGAVREAAVC